MTPQHSNILACITRLVEREGRMAVVKMPLRLWFEARLRYLEDQYRLAINTSDNVIGKQWLFDQRPKLQDRYYPQGEREQYGQR